jgi:hypothetical protein
VVLSARSGNLTPGPLLWVPSDTRERNNPIRNLEFGPSPDFRGRTSASPCQGEAIAPDTGVSVEILRFAQDDTKNWSDRWCHSFWAKRSMARVSAALSFERAFFGRDCGVHFFHASAWTCVLDASDYRLPSSRLGNDFWLKRNFLVSDSWEVDLRLSR